MKEFISYGKQWIDDDDIAAVVRVMKSDYLTQGSSISEFEKKICEITGAKYSIAVANGTVALQLAVMALDIEKGKEGITSPNTFAASANCMVYNGIKPIFADIDPMTYNISIDEIKKRINGNTALIIPVDFAGQTADMEEIYSIAISRGIRIVEDGAHSIGSKYSNGKMVGCNCFSDATIFSFHPVKTITTGEGGAITTNSEEIYEKLKLYRSHGITKDERFLTNNPGMWYYEMQELGYNGRLTDIQAALGVSQLNKLESFMDRRKEIVERYNNAFDGIKGIITPYEKIKGSSCFHLYVLQIDYSHFKIERKKLMELLKERGIGTQVHYIPVHLQPYYMREFGYKKGDYPVAENYYEAALSIPLYPKMKDEDVEYVIENIKELLEVK